MGNARRMGERLMAGLAGIGSPRVRAVRGRGLMVGLELRERAAPIVAALRDEGVLTVPGGANVVRFLPPLVIATAQVDAVVSAVAAVLAGAGPGAKQHAPGPSRLGSSATSARLDDAAATALLTRAVACPSPSGGEERVGRLLVGAMAGAGARAALDEAGNAVGTWGEGPLQVTFLGHMDTVPGHVPVRVEEGRLYGRGSVDAKGSLCAAVAAASRLGKDVLSRVTLRVVGAVEEETASSRGARHAVATLPPPDLVIVGEPSGWDRYTLGYKGRLSLRLCARRGAAHSAREDASAAERLMEAYGSLRGWVEEDNAGAQGAFARLQVTLRDVNTAGDGLVESCCGEVALRVPLRWSGAALAERLRGMDLGEGVSLTVLSIEEPYKGDNTSDLARAFRVAIRGRGGSPRSTSKTGTSDMNVVAPSWRVPMLAYGPGDAALDHTPHEHLELDEYLRSIDVLVAALTELAVGGARPEGRAARPTEEASR